MRIAIVGCGEIGVLCAQRLLAADHKVVAVRRNITTLPHWIDSEAADVTKPETLDFIRRSAFDVLIYQVAASGFTEQAYRQAYVEGVAHVMQQCRGLSTRVLFVSSTGVYHQNDGSWVDEMSETQPQKFNGQLMLEGEQRVTAHQRGSVVRFSGIYGPGRTRLIDQARSGESGKANDGFTNRIHVEDCAGVLSHLVGLSAKESLQPVYLASDSSPALRSEVFGFLAAEMGVMSKVDSSASELPAKRIAGSKRCSNRQLLASGFEFAYPDYRSGYRQVLNTLA